MSEYSVIKCIEDYDFLAAKSFILEERIDLLLPGDHISSSNCCCRSEGESRIDSYLKSHELFIVKSEESVLGIIVIALSIPHEKLASIELLRICENGGAHRVSTLLINHACLFLAEIGYKKVEVSLSDSNKLDSDIINCCGFYQECDSMASVYHSYLPMYFSTIKEDKQQEIRHSIESGEFTAKLSTSDTGYELCIEHSTNVEKHIIIQP